MHFHRSNRAERLIDRLAQLAAAPLDDPFTQETIVVQSRGMERWVSMELSARLGVWANARFPFPRAWIDEVMSRVLGDHEGALRPLTPEAMQWSLAALLPTLAAQPGFGPVASYLRHDDDGRRLLSLAAEIARLFDQYVVFRPKLIAQWDRGEDDDWQAQLWRALIHHRPAEHIAARLTRFQRALTTRTLQLDRLPARVSLFAVSTLPPIYVDMLSQLARHMEVHWFLLSPCKEYWADIRPQREIWTSLQHDRDARPDASLHMIEGQPLLAAWGRVARDLVHVVDERCQQLDGEHDDYVDPGTRSLLQALQSDMLQLRDRSETSEHAPLPLRDDDASITIHACHSEMREVEVLHDQLLARLEADPTLLPHHILVMAPDIDRYAPLIDAVFDAGDEGHRLPYAISERRAVATRPTFDAFIALLDALGSRMTASTVLDLLNIDLIRSRFGIDALDLDMIGHWITQSGARWGIDAEHRSSVGQPALSQNTWRFALDRLLTGYAFDGEGHRLSLGVLPVDDVEGTHTELLGRVVDFCEVLFDFERRARGTHAVSHWLTLMRDLLGAMIDLNGLVAADHRALLASIEELATLATDARFAQPVALRTLQNELTQALERGGSSHGFLSSGITFCRMVPMRSIPFRVIALLGMSHDSFPRNDRDSGLDRSRATREIGDRSARDDDRQLLLEVILSAREQLVVTYVGQGVQDNAARPPSVLIDELLDWCARAFTIDGKVDRATMRQRLVMTHPLQAWSPRYFEAHDRALFTYREALEAGSRALVEASPRAHALFVGALPAPAAAELLDLRDLEEAINDPVRTLIQQRLSVRLGDDADTVDDREPMALDALDAWQVSTSLLDLALRGRSLDNAATVLREGGMVPLGTPGEVTARRAADDAEAIMDLVRPWRARPLPPLNVVVPLDGVTLHGWIRDRFERGVVLTSFSKLSAGQEVRAWIRHLAVNAMDDDGGPRQTLIVGRHEETGEAAIAHFSPLPPALAREHLHTLMAIRADALRSPSPFERKTARAFVTTLLEKQNVELAWKAARGTRGTFGLNPYVQLAFDDVDPLDRDDLRERFVTTARAIYEPLLRHRSVS